MTASVLDGGPRMPVIGVSRSHTGDIKAPRRRISARKLREHSVPADLISRCLWAAFPGRSEHEVCNRAAIYLDECPDTLRRMMRSGDGKLSRVWPILQLGAAAGVEVRLGHD